MILSPAQTAAATVLGGLLALDGTSVAQLMVSRPFVAATLGGVLAGRPAEGMAVGLVLEALHLAVLPVGASRYPEGGPAAVAAGAVYAAAHAPPATAQAALLVAVLLALALEWAGGRTVAALRQFNVRFAGAPAKRTFRCRSASTDRPPTHSSASATSTVTSSVADAATGGKFAA